MQLPPSEHVCPRECERPQVSYRGSGHAQFCPVRKYEAQQEYYGAEGVEFRSISTVVSRQGVRVLESVGLD